MIDQELYKIVVSGFFFGFIPIFLILFKILESIQDNNNYKEQILMEWYYKRNELHIIGENLHNIKRAVYHECNSIMSISADKNISNLINQIEISNLKKQKHGRTKN